MKILTQEKGLAILERAVALGQTEKELPMVDAAETQEGWLRYSIAEGIMEGAELTLDKQTVGALYFHINRSGREKVLHVNAAISLVTFDISAVVELAIRTLAKRKGCTMVECVTQRPGMVKKAFAFGYRIYGVTLRKRL